MADRSLSSQGNLTGPWTIFVCPICGEGPFDTSARAEVHAAVRCEPDAWPWEPIKVVPKGSEQLRMVGRDPSPPPPADEVWGPDHPSYDEMGQ